MDKHTKQTLIDSSIMLCIVAAIACLVREIAESMAMMTGGSTMALSIALSIIAIIAAGASIVILSYVGIASCIARHRELEEDEEE